MLGYSVQLGESGSQIDAVRRRRGGDLMIGKGGEEGEEMAWGRGSRDRGRVELTRVSLEMGGAG